MVDGVQLCVPLSLILTWLIGMKTSLTTNPIAPTMRKPVAVLVATLMNSFLSGFSHLLTSLHNGGGWVRDGKGKSEFGTGETIFILLYEGKENRGMTYLILFAANFLISTVSIVCIWLVSTN